MYTLTIYDIDGNICFQSFFKHYTSGAYAFSIAKQDIRDALQNRLKPKSSREYCIKMLIFQNKLSKIVFEDETGKFIKIAEIADIRKEIKNEQNNNQCL